eukprot:1159738-Pelagomonas_calceolata.AAC.5
MSTDQHDVLNVTLLWLTLLLNELCVASNVCTLQALHASSSMLRSQVKCSKVDQSCSQFHAGVPPFKQSMPAGPCSGSMKGTQAGTSDNFAADFMQESHSAPCSSAHTTHSRSLVCCGK